VVLRGHLVEWSFVLYRQWPPSETGRLRDLHSVRAPRGIGELRCRWGSAQEAAALASLLEALPGETTVEEVSGPASLDLLYIDIYVDIDLPIYLSIYIHRERERELRCRLGSGQEAAALASLLEALPKEATVEEVSGSYIHTYIYTYIHTYIL